ncbi:hypothetical protein GCM10010357_48020 [Streptomyces luteireticuli]|uniref:Secreted protein n=1 Tax=Streptomyces luteireticuli TaxID=173858 RepID=A0ABN0YYC9_9ACTN
MAGAAGAAGAACAAVPASTTPAVSATAALLAVFRTTDDRRCATLPVINCPRIRVVSASARISAGEREYPR